MSNAKNIGPEIWNKSRIINTPAKSWVCFRPRTSAYRFSVTWYPGTLVVTGDIGSAIYETWPGFNTVDKAVEFVKTAKFDYLTSKSNIQKIYDREATTKHIVRYIYEYLRRGESLDVVKDICEKYVYEHTSVVERKKAFREFLEDDSLDSHDIYNLTNDAEDICYSYPSDAEWCYEALKHWANFMSQPEDYSI